MDPKKISMLIRDKKKKMMSADPELVDTDSKPDMNPMDYDNIKQQGRIEETLMTPHKINATDTMIDESPSDAMSIGLTDDEKKRMARLSAYIDTLDMDA